MNSQTDSYLPSRVLKLNAGFLLDGQSRSKDMELDLPRVKVDDDLFFDYVHGFLRMSRTKEGILLQGRLTLGVQGECYRCLEPVQRGVEIKIEELYATSKNIEDDDVEFRVSEDGQVDLVPLVRAEVLIATTRGLRCEDEAACTERMHALEAEAGIDHIDPRMAKLKDLLEQQNNQS